MEESPRFEPAECGRAFDISHLLHRASFELRVVHEQTRLGQFAGDRAPVNFARHFQRILARPSVHKVMKLWDEA